MKKKILYQLLFLLFPVLCFSQDITGVWKGEFYVDSTKKTYPFELTISENKGKLTGYSRISFEEDGVNQVVFRDHTIKMTDTAIVIEDDNQLTKASSVPQPKEVKKIMIVRLGKADTTMQLSGRWSTNRTKRYLAATGTVQLQKKSDFKSTEIFKKLDELSLAKNLSFNKEPVVEVPKEEPGITLNKVTLADVAKADIPKKPISTPAKITKPNLSYRPKEMPIASIKKEVPPPPTKPVETSVAVVKKPAPVVIKSPAVVKPKETAVAKVEKPPVKQPAVAEPKPVAKKNTVLPERKDAATDVANRTINNMQSVFYKSDSLQLTLYDNGEIDGDTVSILLNGKVIIAKKGLDTKPNIFTIYFDRDTPDSQMLVMYAENLGSIPPNTGLLVVREGAAVYEVRFSADLKTNAAVILRRKRDE